MACLPLSFPHWERISPGDNNSRAIPHLPHFESRKLQHPEEALRQRYKSWVKKLSLCMRYVRQSAEDPEVCERSRVRPWWYLICLSVQFSLSPVQLLATPWTATLDLPVHHQLPKCTQTHVHWVSDAIHPSYPLSSPSPPAFNLSQHQSLFQWVFASCGQSIGVWASASVLLMNIQDWLPLGLTGWISLQGTVKSLLQYHSSKASILWCSAFFMVQLSHPSIHDYWKNHNFD